MDHGKGCPLLNGLFGANNLAKLENHERVKLSPLSVKYILAGPKVAPMLTGPKVALQQCARCDFAIGQIAMRIVGGCSK